MLSIIEIILEQIFGITLSRSKKEYKKKHPHRYRIMERTFYILVIVFFIYIFARLVMVFLENNK